MIHSPLTKSLVLCVFSIATAGMLAVSDAEAGKKKSRSPSPSKSQRIKELERRVANLEKAQSVKIHVEKVTPSNPKILHNTPVYKYPSNSSQYVKPLIFSSRVQPRTQKIEQQYLEGELGKTLQSSRDRFLKSDKPFELEGSWLMSLPAGFSHKITLSKASKGRYKLSPQNLNSSGLYRYQQGEFVIEQPKDDRLLGFKWTVVNKDLLILTSQPKTSQTMSNYLGATLSRIP